MPRPVAAPARPAAVSVRCPSARQAGLARRTYADRGRTRAQCPGAERPSSRRRTTPANGGGIMTVTRRPPRPSPRPQPREVDPEFTELIETWLNETPEIDGEAELESDTVEEENAAERE